MKKYEESSFSHLSDKSLDNYLRHMNHEFSEEDIKGIIDKTAQRSIKRKSLLLQLRNNKPAQLVVLAIILLILLPSTIFAATKIWETYFKVDNYSSKLTIKKNETKDSSSLIKDKVYRLEMSYLPDNWGSLPKNEGDVTAKVWNLATQTNDETLSTLLIKMSDNNNLETLYTKNTEELEISGHKVWIINKGGQFNNDMDREVYIFFEEEGYALLLFVGQKIPDDELKKIIAGMKLIESTPDYASYVTEANDFFDTEPSGYVWKDGFRHDTPEESKIVSKDKLAINSPLIKQRNEQIHFKLPTDNFAESGIPREAELGMTVINVKEYDRINEEIDWKNDWFIMNEMEGELSTENLIDGTGGFPTFEVATYQKGDGRSSVDQLVKTENAQFKWVELTVNLENLSIYDVENLFFQSELVILKKKGNFFERKYNITDEKYTTPQFYGKQNNITLSYIDHHGEGKQYLNIGTVKSKSILTLTLGAFVPASDVKNLFLTSISYGDLSQEDSEKIQLFTK